MERTKKRTLLLTGAGGLAAGYVFDLIWESYGNVLLGVPWLAMLGMLILAAVLVVLGLPIKEWRDGNRDTEIDMIQAAKVAMMAKAAAYAGALLTGWYVGNSLYLFLSTGSVRLLSALESLVPIPIAIVLMVVGLIVEWFCKLPPDDPKGTASA